MAGRVIWEEDPGYEYGVRVYAHKGENIIGVQIDDSFRTLTRPQLKSLITALLNYEAELEAAKENT